MKQGADGERSEIAGKLLRWAGRWTRRAIVALLLLVLLVFGLYGTREHTLHPLLVRALPWASRTFSPFEVRVQSIDGDWIGRLALLGLAIEPLSAESPVRSARADRLEVLGHFVELARTQDLTHIERVIVRRPFLEVDATRPRGQDASAERDGALVPDLPIPSFEITDAGARVVLPTDVIEAREVDAVSEGGELARAIVSGSAEANGWRARFQAEVSVTESRGVAFEATLPRGEISELDVEIDELRGEITREQVSLVSGVARVGANQVWVESLSVTPRAGRTPAIGGLVSFDVPRIDEIASMAAAARGVPSGEENPSAFGSVRGTVSLTPDPVGFPNGTIDLVGQDVTVAGVRVGTVNARIDANDDALMVRELRADDSGRALIDASGTFTYATRSISEGSLTLSFDRPGLYFEPLEPLRELNATVALAGPIERLTGRVQATVGRVEQDGETVGNAALDARIDGDIVEVKRLAAETAFGLVEASGRIGLPLEGRPLDVVLRQLSLARDEAQLGLTEEVRILVDGERVKVEGLRLTGSGGEIEIDLDTRSDVGLRVRGEVRSLQLEPFLVDVVGDSADLGVVDGELRFQSEPLEAIVSARLEGVEIPGTGSPIGAAVTAAWRGDRLEVSELRARLENAQVELHGGAPLRLEGELFGDGPVAIDGSVQLDAAALQSGLASALIPPSLASRLRGSMDATIDFDGSWSSLLGSVTVTADEFAVVEADGTPVEWLPGTVSGEASLRAEESAMRLVASFESGGAARLTVEGGLAVPLDVRAVLADPAALLDAAMEGRARAESEDIRWLADLSPDLRETTGRVYAEAQIRGTPRSPDPRGTLRIEEATVRYRGAPSVDDINFQASVDRDRASIDSALFTVGASPVALAGGLDYADGTPRVNLALGGEEVLLFRSRDARVRANVDLRVTGTPSALRVGGDLALVGGRFRSPIEFQNILSGGDAGPTAVRRGIRLPPIGPDSVALDVRVTTADPMRLEGRLTRGEIRADLRLGGLASQPIPSGRLLIDPLEVAVPAGRIRFTTGLIQFLPTQPEIPVLDLVGTTRLAGYDITVNIEGDYDQAVVDFSSAPPLSPDELVLLVLSGRPPGTGSAEAAGQQVALYVAKDLVQGWLSSGSFEEEDRESFLERIEVVTGRDVSRAGLLTIEATYRLREGFVRERDALYLAGERDAYEDYNVGIRFVLRSR